jgi:hypothetical protein
MRDVAERETREPMVILGQPINEIECIETASFAVDFHSEERGANRETTKLGYLVNTQFKPISCVEGHLSPRVVTPIN